MINADLHLDKKPNYPIGALLRTYLNKYEREIHLKVTYQDLKSFYESFPVFDKNGEDTLWESVIYSPDRLEELNQGLCYIYALLKADGNKSILEHLKVNQIDYCTFGNSNPFRIKIINVLNDNHDYFYIKKADASRVYGLELEHILSPNRINYLVDDDTLVEDHIVGIPGDYFASHQMKDPRTNAVRIAKEFVKFNERCLVRLLGDMRSYNFVIDMTPDFDQMQYRIRAIDFDQQSYEGRKTIYLPQYYKENKPYVDICVQYLTKESIEQYKIEERSLLSHRLKVSQEKINILLQAMCRDELSTKEKVNQLKMSLSKTYQNSTFIKCKNMGEILTEHLYYHI